MRRSSCCTAPRCDSVRYNQFVVRAVNLCGSRLLRSSVRQHAIRELSSPLIGWLVLLPVFEVQWALTLSGGAVPMAASDRATGRGSRHSSLTPPPPLALASLGCSPWCESLDEPPVPLLQENKMLARVTRD